MRPKAATKVRSFFMGKVPLARGYPCLFFTSEMGIEGRYLAKSMKARRNRQNVPSV